jgi:hypothetical protein
VDDGLVVRLPPCGDAAACFSPGRRLYGSCETTRGRVAFDVEVLPARAEDAVGPSSVKLSSPRKVRNANHRATYRVPVAPRMRCLVPVCVRPTPDAWKHLRVLCGQPLAADRASSSEPESASFFAPDHFERAVVTDVSLGGVGLAVRASAAFTDALVGQPILVGLALPGLRPTLPCRLEVRWLRHIGQQISQLGGRFDTSGDSLTKRRIEDDLGTWILERQRQDRQKSRQSI